MGSETRWTTSNWKHVTLLTKCKFCPRQFLNHCIFHVSIDFSWTGPNHGYTFWLHFILHCLFFCIWPESIVSFKAFHSCFCVSNTLISNLDKPNSIFFIYQFQCWQCTLQRIWMNTFLKTINYLRNISISIVLDYSFRWWCQCHCYSLVHL